MDQFHACFRYSNVHKKTKQEPFVMVMYGYLRWCNMYLA